MTRPAVHPLKARASQVGLLILLVLPWVAPWAPGPLSNTVPLLLSWGTLALMLAWGRWPTARQWAQGWALAALLSAAMALVQYFGHAATWSGWVHVPGYLGDAVGNLRQRNQLATHLGIGVVAVLYWQRQGLRSAHALAMLLLLSVADAATGSRTGLLQLALLPLLLGLWQWRGPRPWSWALLSASLCAYLLSSWALPRLLTWHTGTQVLSAVARMGDVQGCGSRSVLWSNILHLIQLKPWGGWGWGELKYAHYITDYPGERFCDILSNAHNLPLQMAVELGIPVALLLCLAVLVWLWRARPWQLRHDSDALAWGVLALIGLHSLLEYPLWYGPFQLATLAALWMLWSGTPASTQRILPWLSAAGAGLFLVLALIGLDYQRMRQIYLPASERAWLWQTDPWGAARRTLLFSDTVAFADYTTHIVQLSPQQALAQGLALLHYSPEPRIIEPVIRAARSLGQEALAQEHERHLARAFGQRSDQ